MGGSVVVPAQGGRESTRTCGMWWRWQLGKGGEGDQQAELTARNAKKNNERAGGSGWREQWTGSGRWWKRKMLDVANIWERERQRLGRADDSGESRVNDAPPKKAQAQSPSDMEQKGQSNHQDGAACTTLFCTPVLHAVIQYLAHPHYFSAAACT